MLIFTVTPPLKHQSLQRVCVDISIRSPKQPTNCCNGARNCDWLLPTATPGSLIITTEKQQIMAFEKGRSGNPNGRPRGAKDKATTELRNWVEQFINDNRALIESDIKSLTSNERLRFFLALLNYALPKQQSVKSVGNENGLPFDKNDLILMPKRMDFGFDFTEGDEQETETNRN